MIRCASRARRAICSPRTEGSPVSHPSDTITTMDPRAVPRRPQPSLKAARAAPMRVPPDQSGAAAAARRRATSGLVSASGRVSRVRRVAKTKASARADRTAPWRRWR